MKILITGCGRSGTGYAAKALQALGLQVGHETEGEHGTSDWHAVTWPGDRLRQYGLILHQVRHPLKVIASWHAVHHTAYDYVEETSPFKIGTSDSMIRRASNYWIYWNLLASTISVRTYQLEKLAQDLPGILAAHGVEGLDWSSLSGVPQDYNARLNQYKSGGGLTWERVERDSCHLIPRLKFLADRWGYEG